jgi:lysophospholipase L1-like esterase
MTILIVLLAALEANQRFRNYKKEKKRSTGPYTTSFETWKGEELSHPGGSLTFVHHPHLVHTFKPSQETPQVTINAQGFRGRDWTMERSRAKRIIVLGGSAAFGVDAAGDDKVFISVLERLLNKEDPDRVEVFNAGVIGYGSKQELILLATDLLDYQPDLVLIFDGWNDFYFAGVRPTGVAEAFSPVFDDFDELLSQHTQRLTNVLRVSALFRYAERKLGKRSDASGLPRRFNHYSDNLAVYLPDYRKNLMRMVRLAKAHNVDVMIVVQPELFQRKGKIPEAEQALRAEFETGRHEGYVEYSRTHYPDFIQAAREVAAAERAAFVDATVVFDDFDGVAFTDFVHFTNQGNKVLARFLLPEVSSALKR